MSETEVTYVNHQQGTVCAHCHCNLRAIGLAAAILQFTGFRGTFQQFCTAKQNAHLRILEVNTAGNLHSWFTELPNHVLACYPEVDMQDLPYESGSFDLVVHSDTLEHVPNPIKALSECRRVLRSDEGACIFTIPMITGRLTRRRLGMPPSYHGSRENPSDCLVETEYGADAWLDVFEAGFNDCRFIKIDLPACIPLVAVKHAEAEKERKPSVVD